MIGIVQQGLSGNSFLWVIVILLKSVRWYGSSPFAIHASGRRGLTLVFSALTYVLPVRINRAFLYGGLTQNVVSRAALLELPYAGSPPLWSLKPQYISVRIDVL